MSAALCKHGNPLVECTDEMCCLIYERTPVIPAPASEEATPTDEPRCATCGGRERAAIHTIKGLKVSHNFIAQEPAEALARRFHETYERLAPRFGYETREASAKPWSEVPENNRRLMMAVCGEVLGALSTLQAQQAAEVASLRASLASITAIRDKTPRNVGMLRQGLAYEQLCDAIDSARSSLPATPHPSETAK